MEHIGDVLPETECACGGAIQPGQEVCFECLFPKEEERSDS